MPCNQQVLDFSLSDMDHHPLPCIDQFQEEKLFSLYNQLEKNDPCNSVQQPCLTQVDAMLPNTAAKQEPPPTPSKSGRGRRNSLDEDKNVNRGHWSLEENKKYHWFLEIHYKHFVNRHMRRMDKIFKTMETFIGTRQAEQCRSHHQKMEKKYHNFITIITNLRHQHYGTEDLDPILEDIHANGHSLTQNLATIPQLIEEETANPVIFEVKERRKSVSPKCEEVQVDALMNPQEIEEEKEPEVAEGGEMQCCSVNLWDESHLNIGELMLFHQKDQNSGLFNFH